MTFPKYFLEMLEPLQALQRLITRFEERGVVIGGMAVGFLGNPRFTVDVDAMFWPLRVRSRKFLDWRKKRALNHA